MQPGNTSLRLYKDSNGNDTLDCVDYASPHQLHSEQVACTNDQQEVRTYGYNEYIWDGGIKNVVADLNGTNYIPVTPYEMAYQAPVDQYVATDSQNFGYADYPNKLVQVFYLGGGSVDLALINVLELSLIDWKDISAGGGKGYLTLRVEPADGLTPVGNDYKGQPITIEGHVALHGTLGQNTAWQTFTQVPGELAYECTFEVTAAGTYDYEVRVSDKQYIAPGSKAIAQAVAPPAGTTYKVALAAVPQPTPRGQAGGQIEVGLTGGPGVVQARLYRAGETQQYRPTQSTAALAANTSTATLTFKDLPAGFYDVKATTDDAGVHAEALEVNVLPPDLAIGDQLTFLPWVQPALTHAADGIGRRPTLRLEATLRTDHGTDPSQPDDLIQVTQAEIYGPGDVLGLNQRAVLATAPTPGTTSFSPLALAFIDFKDEDLPWRYSSLKIAGSAPGVTPVVPAVPLPWCQLLVLRDDEFQALPQTGQPLPSLKITSGAAYPSRTPSQQQLWAHVQVNKSLGTTLDKEGKLQPPTEAEINTFLTVDLPKSPDLAYSRVVCPRRLDANTAYTAVLVPAVEAGRLAGLGLDFDATDVATSALPAAGATGVAAERVFPVYFQWKFSTGSEDDFETLAEQLHSANAATRVAPAPGLALTTAAGITYQLPMVGALADAATTAPAHPTPAAALSVAQYLYGQLLPGRSASGRPLVAAPLYGRAYFVTPTLEAPAAGIAPSWKHQLNLDPRYRALAAVGAEVVRDNQEEYVRRAWDQVQDILLANEKLRGAQYGLRTSAGLRDQHLPLNTTVTTTTTTTGSGQRLAAGLRSFAVASESKESSESGVPATRTHTGLADYGLHLTGPAMRRVRVSAATAQATPELAGITVREAIRRSDVPLAAFSPAFRRIAKPFGQYMVGQAGRPLRATQPEDPTDPDDLRQPGTSLRQRDALLSQLSDPAHPLAAAPAHAEALRTYQFSDDLVDTYLAAAAGPAPTVALASPTLGADFEAAFRSFVNQHVEAATQVTEAVGFRRPQYVRPRLPLAELKADLVEGTKPGPVFIEKIKTVAPTLGDLPALAVPTGDFLGDDYNASHFYVGDFDEPGHLVGGDWLPADFAAADFLVPRQVWDYETSPTDAPAGPAAALASEQPTADDASASNDASRTTTEASAAPAARSAFAARLNTLNTVTTTTTTTAPPAATDATLPVIKQAKVFPVFKEAMGEHLRQRHPELFVPGLGDFPSGGVAVLDVNHAFIEAYMVGLNHALGAELHWRGFPVELRGTFFQQFWDVSERLNTSRPAGTAPSAADEAALLDIKPLDKWISNELGTNAVTPPQAGTDTLRLVLRSELLRRYPTLVVALQDSSLAPTAAVPPVPYTDPARYLYPRQRLAVGQDAVIVTFDVDLAHARASCDLVLLERPGQPTFGLDAAEPGADLTQDPLSWNDLTWDYAGTAVGAFFEPATSGARGSTPHASAEPAAVAYLTNSAQVAYALFQEPIQAILPLQSILS